MDERDSASRARHQSTLDNSLCLIVSGLDSFAGFETPRLKSNLVPDWSLTLLRSAPILIHLYGRPR